MEPLDYTPRYFAMPPRIARYRWDEVPLDKVTEMVACKSLGGEQLQLTQAYFKKGTRVPVHAHAGERLGLVTAGVAQAVAALPRPRSWPQARPPS